MPKEFYNINPPSDNSINSLQQLATELNRQLLEISAELAALKGTDALNFVQGNDVDMGNKRLRNVGAFKADDEIVTRRTLKKHSIYKATGSSVARINFRVASQRAIARDEYVTLDQVDKLVQQAIGSLKKPVGSIEINTTGTNPAVYLKYGTWSAFGAGKVLAGYLAADADFGVAEGTGGAKVHAHAIDVPSTVSGAPSATTMVDNDGALSTVAVGSSTHTHAVDPASFNTVPASDPTPTDQLPPYIVVYFWKRTA